MPTVSEVVTTSLQHLRVLGAGEVADSDDSEVCRAALVSMLDAWNLDPQAIVGLTELTYTPGGGLQSFTIGPSGNVVAAQPARIVSAFYRKSDVDYPLPVITVDEYTRGALKSTQTEACAIALNRGYDTAEVYIYPAADGLSEFHLWVQRDVVSSFSTLALTTSMTLPNGLQNALEWNVAREVLNAFSVDPATEARVERNAQNALRRFKRANVRVPELQMPGGARQFDAEAGY